MPTPKQEKASAPVRVVAEVRPLPAHQARPAPVLDRPQAQGDVLARPWPKDAEEAILRQAMAAAAVIPEGDAVEVLRHHWLAGEDGPIGWAPVPQGTSVLGTVAVPAGTVAVLRHADHHADIALGGPQVWVLSRQRQAAQVPAVRRGWFRSAATAPAPVDERARLEAEASRLAAKRAAKAADKAYARAKRASRQSAARQRRAAAEAAIRQQEQLARQSRNTFSDSRNLAAEHSWVMD